LKNQKNNNYTSNEIGIVVAFYESNKFFCRVHGRKNRGLIFMRIKEHPILDFKRGKRVYFTFNGRKIEGYDNETIAAALHAAGIKVYGHTPVKNRPRGFFCAIGKCSSCFMTVNGIPNVRSCTTKLREGMVIKSQEGRGELFGTSKY